MKAKLLPELSWSKWYNGPFGNIQYSYLHHWDGDVHIDHHNVKIVRYYSSIVGGILYEYTVSAGVYGERGYGHQDEIRTVKEARRLAEEAAQSALRKGDLQIAK